MSWYLILHPCMVETSPTLFVRMGRDEFARMCYRSSFLLLFLSLRQRILRLILRVSQTVSIPLNFSVIYT